MMVLVFHQLPFYFFFTRNYSLQQTLNSLFKIDSVILFLYCESTLDDWLSRASELLLVTDHNNWAFTNIQTRKLLIANTKINEWQARLVQAHWTFLPFLLPRRNSWHHSAHGSHIATFPLSLGQILKPF